MPFKYISVSLVLICFSFMPADKEETQTAVEKGKIFLKKIQRADGAICDTVNPLFDTWETILAAHALYDIDKDTNEVAFKKALSYLRNNESTNHLICHNKKCKQSYCLETTAQYFLLLIKIGEIEKVKQNLKFIQELQKPTGEWEIGNPDVKEQKSFPSVTAFMLQLFSKADVKPKYEPEAYLWLMSSQNKMGHWGSAWEYYNSPAYAIWAACPLKPMYSNFYGTLARTHYYIIKNQLKNGSWNYIDLDQSKAPSAELQTALMLSALNTIPSEESKKARQNAIKYLLQQQKPDGSWDGGYFPIKSDSYIKKEYVFATALSLIELNQIKLKEK